MDGKGWKPEYGISAEGIDALGYIEALPREVRRELAEAIGTLCRREGYLSLHDDLRARFAPAGSAGDDGKLAKVIPLFRHSRRG